MSYDIGWVRSEVARLIDFDSTQADQAFAGGANDVWSTIHALITRAYAKIVNEAALEVSHTHFKVNYLFTWPASQLRYILPEEVAGTEMLGIWDVTNTNVGSKVLVYDYQYGSLPFWFDRKTIQWGENGPGSARNLRLAYLANAEEIVYASQVPVLVPFRHRHLLVWETAVQARLEADEDNVPQLWMMEAKKCMDLYVTDLSKGVLQFTNRARITDLGTRSLSEVSS